MSENLNLMAASIGPIVRGLPTPCWTDDDMVRRLDEIIEAAHDVVADRLTEEDVDFDTGEPNSDWSHYWMKVATKAIIKEIGDDRSFRLLRDEARSRGLWHACFSDYGP